ncbi:MAG TPA: alkaline phosphatase family protein [Planctomycetota bacterium]|nr:alkaline phosphatase family protein [Planctomycetota bacterium]
MKTPPLLLYVPGLAHRLAIRPDLAKHLSNLIERGVFAPVFPVFPALPGPMLATLRTGEWPESHGVIVGSANGASGPEFQVLDDFDRVARERGPADPGLGDAFRALDARIGNLAGSSDDVVVVSDGAVSPAPVSIDIGGALRERFGADVTAEAEEQVCVLRTARLREVADFVRTLAKGIRVLCGARDFTLYRVRHANAGDAIALAPPHKRFGSPGPRGTRGQLPLDPGDYGVFISTRHGSLSKRFMLAVEAAAEARR